MKTLNADMLPKLLNITMECMPVLILFVNGEYNTSITPKHNLKHLKICMHIKKCIDHENFMHSKKSICEI